METLPILYASDEKALATFLQLWSLKGSAEGTPPTAPACKPKPSGSRKGRSFARARGHHLG